MHRQQKGEETNTGSTKWTCQTIKIQVFLIQVNNFKSYQTCPRQHPAGCLSSRQPSAWCPDVVRTVINNNKPTNKQTQNVQTKPIKLHHVSPAHASQWRENDVTPTRHVTQTDHCNRAQQNFQSELKSVFIFFNCYVIIFVRFLLYLSILKYLLKSW